MHLQAPGGRVKAEGLGDGLPRIWEPTPNSCLRRNDVTPAQAGVRLRVPPGPNRAAYDLSHAL
jgi:hypothetical protein